MNRISDLPYVIFEVANVHGGDRDELFHLIAEYTAIDYQNKAIKFQPLNPDQIALPDYKWFQVYQELYFEPGVWAEAIALAAKCGEVWLDIFDVYGIEVLQTNLKNVHGIKLQASVLDNIDLVNGLTELDLEQIRLMINISGFEMSSIESYVEQFQRIGFAEIILQIGYQGYPTSVADTGLQKLAVLEAAFPSHSLCIADHSAAEMPVSRQIPGWAVAAGCTYVEKHFCSNRSRAKYDYFSSLEPEEFRDMLENLGSLHSASHGRFISHSEARYLKDSYQAPVLRHDMALGELVGATDLLFRRTNQSGLTKAEIETEQSQFNIIANSKPRLATFAKTDFRKARIGVIVACRMKSTRLKKKAVLPINGVAAVERCLQNCLNMAHVDEVILATSDLEEDQVLGQHTLGGRAKFWQGDPDDVIHRYLGACELYGLDVIVRVTADCPAVSPEITDYLIRRHFEAGADYTAPVHCAVGSSPEIYNVEALRRVISIMGKAEHSEYMTWYMRNNADFFKVNLVDLPPELVRDYRLTLDYQEDWDMFNRLYSILADKGLDASIRNVFSVLDGDGSIPGINQHLTLSYKTDSQLIEKLNKVTRITEQMLQAATLHKATNK